MKRPILIISVGFIIGILLGLYFRIGIAFLFVLFFIKRFNKSVALLIITSSVVSFIYISYSEKQYASRFIGIDRIKGNAIVVSVLQEKQYYLRYMIRYEDTNLILKTNSELQYGDLIEFDGEFEIANTQRNYGGFDYREYLKTKKIYGIVTSKKVKIIEHNQLSRLEMFTNSIKNSIENQIKNIDAEETGDLLIRFINRK